MGQLTIGGLERQVYLLASGLARGVFDVTVVSMASGGDWAAPLREAGVRVEELHRRGHMDWRRLLAMRAVFKTLRPDVVYSFNYEGNVYSRIAGLLAGVPILITGERGIYMSGFMALVERLLNRFTECVICNAEAIRRDLVRRVGIPQGKVITIPNAVLVPPPFGAEDRRSARRLIGANDDEIVVGTIGRMESIKNHELLVRAASLGRPAGRNLRYCVIGDGPDEKTVRAAIDQEGLRDRFSLVGSRRDAVSLLPAFDIFVLTSKSEGLPNTVMEAMAAGLPCVCTDVGGCRELVEEGMTGYLVAADDPRALAERILDLAADPSRRARMGQAGRRRISTGYSVEQLVSRVEQILLRLLEASGSRGRGHRLPVNLVEVG